MSNEITDTMTEFNNLLTQTDDQGTREALTRAFRAGVDIGAAVMTQAVDVGAATARQGTKIGAFVSQAGVMRTFDTEEKPEGK